ncbi:MAG: NifU family protein [Bacteroidia bacterium]|nr:NifU family protein [Bacteroidia bacterium]
MKRKALMHVEGVPNPNAMKIVLENGILTDEPYEFQSFIEAEPSPLARKLMMFRYIERVMINFNYVTIVKAEKGSPAWDEILPELQQLIQDHLEQNEPILYVGARTLVHRRSDDIVMKLVHELLDKRIRPAAQEDGGDIVYESFRDGVLNLTMHGACHHCPYAHQTLRDGVEKVIIAMVPEVRRVTATSNGVL